MGYAYGKNVRINHGGNEQTLYAYLLSPDSMAGLHDLLACTNKAQFVETWRSLTADERRALRPNRPLAAHAWDLIIRDRILTGATS